jgi:hypothetical protein
MVAAGKVALAAVGLFLFRHDYAAQAACCCDYPNEEVWEIVWCQDDAGSNSPVLFHSGIPNDGSFGSCTNWAGAGAEGEYSTVTMAAINDQYGSDYPTCASLFGAGSNCSAADALFQNYEGENVVCLTPAEMDALRAPDNAATFALSATAAAAALLAAWAVVDTP